MISLLVKRGVNLSKPMNIWYVPIFEDYMLSRPQSGTCTAPQPK